VLFKRAVSSTARVRLPPSPGLLSDIQPRYVPRSEDGEDVVEVPVGEDVAAVSDVLAEEDGTDDVVGSGGFSRG